MSILDKANKYIGHPREADEGYEVSMRRDAYAQGYQDAIKKAYEWILSNMPKYIKANKLDVFINNLDMASDFRKAME